MNLCPNKKPAVRLGWVTHLSAGPGRHVLPSAVEGTLMGDFCAFVKGRITEKVDITNISEWYTGDLDFGVIAWL